VGFGVFFADGLLGYQPIVRRLHRHWLAAAGDTVDHVRMTCLVTKAEQCQPFLHLVSVPILFVIGAFRWEWPRPAGTQKLLQRVAMQLVTLPRGWCEVLIALAVISASGVSVATARWFSASRRVR